MRNGLLSESRKNPDQPSNVAGSPRGMNASFAFISAFQQAESADTERLIIAALRVTSVFKFRLNLRERSALSCRIGGSVASGNAVRGLFWENRSLNRDALGL